MIVISNIKKCWSIDDKKAGQIGRIAAERGRTESDIVESLISYGLRTTAELTAVERYHYQRDCIMKALDSVLHLFGVVRFEGGIGDMFRACLYMAHGNHRVKNREYRNGILEISLFEVLNDIKELDKNIWHELTSDMAYFGNIRDRYFQLYPK